MRESGSWAVGGMHGSSSKKNSAAKALTLEEQDGADSAGTGADATVSVSLEK